MSKIKKIFAVLLTLALVMGMSITTFAAPSTISPYNSNITITGLASGEKTTVKAYQAIALNEAENGWEVAGWAKDYIKLSSDGKTYEITDAAELGKAAEAIKEPFGQKESNGAMEVVFENVPVGAYVLLAAGDKVTSYTTMVANTYDADQTYMASKDVTVVAKTDRYTVDKKADDNFVGRGERVTFTVTTIFPSFTVPDSKDNSYQIIDTPTGLEIGDVTKVEIGGVPVEGIAGIYVEENYVIDLTSQIGTSNENAGKEVKVTYEAIVTSDEGYSNTVNVSRNNVNLGKDDEKGFTGDITLTKVAEDQETTLKGAEFLVAKKSEDGTLGENLYFVAVEAGVYKLALSPEEEDATTTVTVADDGTVKLTGLDEGNYHFTETKAPEGYSINADGVDVEVVENKTANVSFKGTMVDTKLSSLPGTGGIGTTIFTIGGCIIMIIAAALFFASRKKSSK